MGSSRSSAGRLCAAWRLDVGRIASGCHVAVKLALCALVPLFLSAAPLDRADRAVRVRFEWVAQKPERWAGVLELSEGTIAHPASLGVDCQGAGTLWADGKCLWLSRQKPTDHDGFEVSLAAAPSAHLSFTLESQTHDGPRQRFECLLSDLEGESKCLSAKNQSLRLSVRRAPGDCLRIVVDRPSLIYRPGETFHATLVPDVLSSTPPTADAKIKWVLCAPPRDQERRRGSIRLGQKSAALREQKGTVPVEIPLPTEEGPFALRFWLSDNRLGGPRSSVELLVLDDRPSRETSAGRGADVLIDRLTAADFESESKRRIKTLLPWLSPPPQPALCALEQKIVQDPAAEDPRAHGIALLLRLKHQQQPHRLVIHVADGCGSSLGASLLDLNGQLHTGVILADADGSGRASFSDPGGLQHEILFWPQMSEPVLLLHDVGCGRRPQVTAIEVYELGARTRPPVDRANRASERLIGPYLAKPLLPENFGGLKVRDARKFVNADSGSECYVEDLETYHAAAEHVAEYLARNNYNSLLLAALADGLTIYPSAHLETTTGYDSGAVSPQRIPLRHDFLELVYRVFDREGLTLIPELQFSCPLPELERQLVDGAAAEGIELVAADGHSARDHRGQSTESLPEYNPLDPRVQDAVLSVVREAVARYQHHPSFRGVALQITRSGYLQLPGLDWGYDTATIRRFEHDKGVTVDGSAGGDIFQHRREVLLGEARSDWIRWRCQEMAKFYRRLAETMATARPEARLILACKQVLPDPSHDDESRREIRSRGRLSELLAARGIDFSLVSDAPRLVVLKGAIWRASANVEEELLEEALSQTASFGRAFQSASMGVLDYRSPRCFRQVDFDRLSPWQPVRPEWAVVASPSPGESRRRFVRALAETDAQMIFVGSGMVPLGQERSTDDLRRIACAIPSIPFYKVTASDQSAVVHVARHHKKTYIYAVNPFAQPFQLALDVSCRPGTACRPLGPSPALVETAGAAPAEGQNRLTTSLNGYGLGAWEIDHEDARVLAIQTQIPAAELAQLEMRAARFQQQLAVARRTAQSEQGLAASSSTNQAAGTATPHDTASPALQAESGLLVLASGRGSNVGTFADAPPEGESLSPDDLRQLAKISLQLALAVDEKRVAECQSLLDSYWCRYLAVRFDSAPPALLREAAKPPGTATR